ncbi:MAG: hypothetical protein ACKPCP_38165 [Sphaerospermopsis kisseleviana]
MNKGFSVKQIKYILESGNIVRIPFLVEWEGRQKKTDKRAINTAGLIWGLLVNPHREDIYEAVADKLDPASARVILETAIENEGRRFNGVLKVELSDGSFVRLVEYATHEGMRANLKKHEAIDFAKAL